MKGSKFAYWIGQSSWINQMISSSDSLKSRIITILQNLNCLQNGQRSAKKRKSWSWWQWDHWRPSGVSSASRSMRPSCPRDDSLTPTKFISSTSLWIWLIFWNSWIVSSLKIIGIWRIVTQVCQPKSLLDMNFPTAGTFRIVNSVSWIYQSAWRQWPRKWQCITLGTITLSFCHDGDGWLFKWSREGQMLLCARLAGITYK